MLRADGESAHETTGIHQAEGIDEDGALALASIQSQPEPEAPGLGFDQVSTKPKIKLGPGRHPEEDQKMNRSHHRSTPGAYTALSNGHLDIGNWERPRRSASVFDQFVNSCNFT